jgi:DNA-binding HxlR family transcriptional regulator
MPRPDHVSKCRAEDALAIIRGKWRLAILYELQHGPVRFRTLQRAIGRIRHKVLTSELKQLADLGVVQRNVLQEAPALAVEYGLTAFGQEVKQLLIQIGAWTADHSLREATPPSHAP